VNCLHVLDELRPLEEKWSEELVVVGVHSPKFEFEKDPEALAANIGRYEVTHPVLDDPELLTWTAYEARAWPTLTVLDTRGRVAAKLSGEGHAANLDELVGRLVAEAEANGSLRRGPAPTILEQRAPRLLSYPSKAATLEDGRVVVSDPGAHRLVVLAADGGAAGVVGSGPADAAAEVIGAGRRGHQDGPSSQATFAEPNGVLVLPPELAEQTGYPILVADSANHLLRSVRPGAPLPLGGTGPWQVKSVAGTGSQWMQGDTLPSGDPGTDPRSLSLSTPWDLTWSRVLDRVVIAMAGIHQIWTLDPRTGALDVLAGTTQEGLVDGPLDQSWWAQPSGIVEQADGTLAVADSESSAIRVIDPVSRTVTSVVGLGLFDFGHVDGPLERARFQHPLGLAALPDGRIAVADTYNGALRLLDPAAGRVVTLATGLAEPSAVLAVPHAGPADEPATGRPATGTDLLVVESGGHRLQRIDLDATPRTELDQGAQRTARPVTEIGPGTLQVRVQFTPPPGHKLDNSLGPSTQVSISTTPAAMLRSGEGTSTDLDRVIELDAAYTEGVLHVSARAASCDADPTVEFPACHMHQQDWGVPIRVREGAPDTLDLALLGEE
jgi:hypothetical protein